MPELRTSRDHLVHACANVQMWRAVRGWGGVGVAPWRRAPRCVLARCCACSNDGRLRPIAPNTQHGVQHRFQAGLRALQAQALPRKVMTRTALPFRGRHEVVVVVVVCVWCVWEGGGSRRETSEHTLPAPAPRRPTGTTSPLS